MDRLYLMTSEDETGKKKRKRQGSPLSTSKQSKEFTLVSQQHPNELNQKMKRQKSDQEEAKYLQKGGIMPFNEKQTTADEGHQSSLM